MSSVKPPEAIKNAVVGDQKKDCGENDPDLVSRLQWQEYGLKLLTPLMTATKEMRYSLYFSNMR